MSAMVRSVKKYPCGSLLCFECDSPVMRRCERNEQLHRYPPTTPIVFVALAHTRHTVFAPVPLLLPFFCPSQQGFHSVLREGVPPTFPTDEPPRAWHVVFHDGLSTLNAFQQSTVGSRQREGKQRWTYDSLYSSTSCAAKSLWLGATATLRLHSGPVVVLLDPARSF